MTLCYLHILTFSHCPQALVIPFLPHQPQNLSSLEMLRNQCRLGVGVLVNLSFISMNINLSPCFPFSIPVPTGISSRLHASHSREILQCFWICSAVTEHRPYSAWSVVPGQALGTQARFSIPFSLCPSFQRPPHRGNNYVLPKSVPVMTLGKEELDPFVIFCFLFQVHVGRCLFLGGLD